MGSLLVIWVALVCDWVSPAQGKAAVPRKSPSLLQLRSVAKLHDISPHGNEEKVKIYKEAAVNSEGSMKKLWQSLRNVPRDPKALEEAGLQMRKGESENLVNAMQAYDLVSALLDYPSLEGQDGTMKSIMSTLIRNGGHNIVPYIKVMYYVRDRPIEDKKSLRYKIQDLVKRLVGDLDNFEHQVSRLAASRILSLPSNPRQFGVLELVDLSHEMETINRAFPKTEAPIDLYMKVLHERINALKETVENDTPPEDLLFSLASWRANLDDFCTDLEDLGEALGKMGKEEIDGRLKAEEVREWRERQPIVLAEREMVEQLMRERRAEM